MRIYIDFYAGLKSFFKENMELEIDKNCTVNDLRKRLLKKNPEAASLINFCRFARDDFFISKKTSLKKNDRISLIPPVSGG